MPKGSSHLGNQLPGSGPVSKKVIAIWGAKFCAQKGRTILGANYGSQRVIAIWEARFCAQKGGTILGAKLFPRKLKPSAEPNFGGAIREEKSGEPNSQESGAKFGFQSQVRLGAGYKRQTSGMMM